LNAFSFLDDEPNFLLYVNLCCLPSMSVPGCDRLLPLLAAAALPAA
jgi:hypothetical protein